MLFGEQPDLSKARVWGCDAYVYIELKERSGGKSVPRATRMTFTGFCEYSKSAILVNMETPHKVVKRGMTLIKFVENSFTGFIDAGANIPEPAFLGYDFDLTISLPPGKICSTPLTTPITFVGMDVYLPHEGDTVQLMLGFTRDDVQAMLGFAPCTDWLH